MSATLPDGSRLQASLGKSVTPRGSSFVIRKFSKSPFTPIDLIKYGTFTPEMLAYLWLAVENNKNLMVIGGTACGKTCTLNAISLFIPPLAKIVTIEDTRELLLYHENWIPSITHETVGERAIEMYDLLRQALRQRPECIIVGEVRGKEALTLFQSMSVGHTCYSTMHAGTVQEAVNRLENEPINVPNMMLQALDIVCVQILTSMGKKRVRRNQLIVEFTGIEPSTGDIRINEMNRWNPETDTFDKVSDSHVLKMIMKERGWDFTKLNEEIENRKRILEYMIENGITDYRKIASLIELYYMDPEKAMRSISTPKSEIPTQVPITT